MKSFLRKSFRKKSVKKGDKRHRDNDVTEICLTKVSNAPAKKTLLHGHLILKIIEARNLPDMESSLAKLMNKRDVTDAFVEAWLGGARVAKTSIIKNNLNPVWNETYNLDVCHFVDKLRFEIRDKDQAYSEYIGAVEIPTDSLLTEEIIHGWFPILKSNDGQNTKAELNLYLQFKSQTSNEKTYEVDCYFPVRRNCLVTLYQDAHSLGIQQMPQFNLLSESMSRFSSNEYVPRSCWKDIYYSLIEAKHMICITGWSVWHTLKLLRGEDSDIDGRTLGEILADKARDGVQVYVMIWYDLSRQMGTKWEETYYYFKNTQVHCAAVTREVSVREASDIAHNLLSKTVYTHHQKSVICDAPCPGDLRRLVAFVGGLDLTGGRYDTPNHELYSTLNNEHKDDFRNRYNKDIPQSQGPREPWHDIHCKVEGCIAYDVFLNFEERWSKQSGQYGDLNEINRNVIDMDFNPSVQDPSKEWCCQLFRSITSDSVNFHQTDSKRLSSKTGRMVDSSIAKSYVQMIRNAEHFIYIENQYFYGSAYCWNEEELNDLQCQNLIPSEIAQKVIDKILANEPFTAYIVVPMFPEGDPTSNAVQEILFMQYKTMEMMYQRVGEAITQVGSATHPTDWLLFLCLGKREPSGPHLDQLEKPLKSVTKRLRETLRFPIYLHSKMMIVDDVYAIIGSANINDRSLCGTRDTEMAVGCWQPHFDVLNPSGDVNKFRMSLWTEHFNQNVSAFLNPGTIECVKKVKQFASHNWQMYTGPTGSVTTGQILTYPLKVMQDGELQNLDGVETFPDFPIGSSIMGRRWRMAPTQKITT
jgi:phospholipase D1/2